MTVLAVFLAALATALATGLGALPILLSRRNQTTRPVPVAAATLVAASAMVVLQLVLLG